MTDQQEFAIDIVIRAASDPDGKNGKANLAKALGITRPAISRAVRKKLIPVDWVLAIEQKFGVARQIQRPDYYPS